MGILLDAATTETQPVEDFLQEKLRNNVPFVDLQEEFRRRYPDTLASTYFEDYEKQRVLPSAIARERTTRDNESLFTSGLRNLSRKSVPFLSAMVGLVENEDYKDAEKRVVEGKASERDYETVAKKQVEQQIEKDESTGEAIGKAAFHLPAILGEMAAGGKAVSWLGKAAMGGKAAATTGEAVSATKPLWQRAATQAGKSAAMTPLTPTAYLEQASQRSQMNGGEFYEAKNLGPAMLMGAAQNIVLGSLQKSFGGMQTGGWLGRVGAKTAVSVPEQIAADTLNGLVVDGILDQKGGYGITGEVSKAWMGGTEDEKRQANKHAATTLATFGMFSAMHGKYQPGQARWVKAYKQMEEELKAQGVPKEEVRNEAARIINTVVAETEAPTATKSDGEVAPKAIPDNIPSTPDARIEEQARQPEMTVQDLGKRHGQLVVEERKLGVALAEAKLKGRPTELIQKALDRNQANLRAVTKSMAEFRKSVQEVVDYAKENPVDPDAWWKNAPTDLSNIVKPGELRSQNKAIRDVQKLDKTSFESEFPHFMMKNEPKVVKNTQRMASLVQEFGGIDPNSLALKAYFSDAKEARENGIKSHAFRHHKGGPGRQGLDALAQELWTAGYLPEAKEAADAEAALIEALRENRVVDNFGERQAQEHENKEWWQAREEALKAFEARHAEPDPRREDDFEIPPAKVPETVYHATKNNYEGLPAIGHKGPRGSSENEPLGVFWSFHPDSAKQATGEDGDLHIKVLNTKGRKTLVLTTPADKSYHDKYIKDAVEKLRRSLIVFDGLKPENLKNDEDVIFIGGKKRISQAITDKMIADGYDSVYFKESGDFIELTRSDVGEPAPEIVPVEAPKAEPESVGKRYYRQMNAEEASQIVGRENDRGPWGIPERFMADSKDLALGQGKNASGVMVEFNPEGLEARENTAKPGLAFTKATGSGTEYTVKGSTESIADSVVKITIPDDLPKSPFKSRLLLFLKQNGWSSKPVENGVEYIPPVKKSEPTPTVEKPASQPRQGNIFGGVEKAPPKPAKAAVQGTLTGPDEGMRATEDWLAERGLTRDGAWKSPTTVKASDGKLYSWRKETPASKVEVYESDADGNPIERLPPVAPGYIRMWHGGAWSKGFDENSRAWIAYDRRRAESYARNSGGKLYYTDIPENHPELEPNKAPAGKNSWWFEASPELTKTLRAVDAPPEPPKPPTGMPGFHSTGYPGPAGVGNQHVSAGRDVPRMVEVVAEMHAVPGVKGVIGDVPYSANMKAAQQGKPVAYADPHSGTVVTDRMNTTDPRPNMEDVAHIVTHNLKIETDPTKLSQDIRDGLAQFDNGRHPGNPNIPNSVNSTTMIEGIGQWAVQRMMGYTNWTPQQKIAAMFLEGQFAPVIAKFDRIGEMYRANASADPITGARTEISTGGNVAARRTFAEKAKERLDDAYNAFIRKFVNPTNPLMRLGKWISGEPGKKDFEQARVMWSLLHNDQSVNDHASLMEQKGFWTFDQDGHRVYTNKGLKHILAAMDAKLVEPGNKAGKTKLGVAHEELKKMFGGDTQASDFDLFVISNHIVDEANKFFAFDAQQKKIDAMKAAHKQMVPGAAKTKLWNDIRAEIAVRNGLPNGVDPFGENKLVSERQYYRFKDAMDEFAKDPQTYAQLLEGHRRYVEYMNAGVDMLADPVVHNLNREYADMIKTRWDWYAPLSRVHDALGMTTKSGMYERRVGSDMPIMAPLISLKMKTQAIAARYVQQMKMNAAMKILGQKGMGKAASGLFEIRDVTQEGTNKWLDIQAALAAGDQAKVDAILEQSIATDFTYEPWKADGKNIVQWHQADGRLMGIQIHDKNLYDLLTNRQMQGDGVAQALNWITQLPGVKQLTQLQTHLATSTNAAFQIFRNTPRDVFDALANTKHLGNPAMMIKELGEAFGKMYAAEFQIQLMGKPAKDVLADLYLTAGGRGQKALPWSNEYKTSVYRGIGGKHGPIETLQNGWDFFKKVTTFAGSAELAPRFREALKIWESLGYPRSRIEANIKANPNRDPMPYDVINAGLYGSQDLTGNFPTKGVISKELGRANPFFTAAIAGIYKNLRATRDNPLRMATMVALGLTAKLMHYALYKDEEWYKELAPHDRYANTPIKIGNRVYRFPGPRDIHVPIGAMTIAGLDELRNKDPQWKGAIDLSLKSMLPPGVSDTAVAAFQGNTVGVGKEMLGMPLGPGVQTGLDLATNESWTGAPIIPKRETDRHLPWFERTRDYTVPYVGQQMLAGRSRDWQSALGLNIAPEIKPLRSVNDLYQRMDELEERAGREKYRGGNLSAEQENELRRLKAAAKSINALAEKARGESRNERGSIIARRVVSDQEKREIQQKQVQIARAALGRK